MFQVDVLTLFAILGIAQALFFAGIILVKNRKQLFNRVLALLLFVTSVRIAKNIIVHLREIDPDLQMPYATWRMLVNVGLTHQFAIGPLFYLYFLFRIQSQNTFPRRHLLHFIPFAVLLALASVIEWNFWASIGLWLSYAHVLFYYLLSLRLYRNFSTSQQKTKNWLRNLLLIAGLLMLAYSPALFKYVGYVNGALIYTVGIYFSMVILLGNPSILAKKKGKYQSSALSDDRALQLKTRLEKIMQEEQPYLDSELTLGRLAKQLDISPTYLSQVINEQFDKNFAAYINEFRVEMAKQKLSEAENIHLKIASLAYDSGFNSLATFNAIFKKQVGTTPSAYRKEALSVKNA